MRAPVSNPVVAEVLDMSPTGVSRLRSGHRNPSLETMCRIEEQFDWDIASQVKQFREGYWHVGFEAVLSQSDLPPHA